MAHYKTFPFDNWLFKWINSFQNHGSSSIYPFFQSPFLQRNLLFLSCFPYGVRQTIRAHFNVSCSYSTIFNKHTIPSAYNKNWTPPSVSPKLNLIYLSDYIRFCLFWFFYLNKAVFLLTYRALSEWLIYMCWRKVRMSRGLREIASSVSLFLKYIILLRKYLDRSVSWSCSSAEKTFFRMASQSRHWSSLYWISENCWWSISESALQIIAINSAHIRNLGLFSPSQQTVHLRHCWWPLIKTALELTHNTYY